MEKEKFSKTGLWSEESSGRESI
ncbi:hypothetical protein TNCV_2060821, partial [Trichonephila clavipes]